MSLINSKGQTGNWYTDVGLGVFDWIFNPEPGLSDADFTSRSVKRAKTVMNYVNNSQFKYLIYDSSARKKAIQELSSLESKIKAQQPKPYKNNSDNLKYQQAMIGYVRGVIDMNKNFGKSKENMFYLISHLN